MHQIAEFVAVLACSLFAGASVYINLVEHPARMECGVELAATEFPPSYRRASVMQATLAAVGLLSSIAAWFAGASFLWVVGGLALGAMVCAFAGDCSEECGDFELLGRRGRTRRRQNAAAANCSDEQPRQGIHSCKCRHSDGLHRVTCSRSYPT